MFRTSYFLGFSLCFIALVSALVMQYGFGLEPCALCVLSRFAVIGLGLLFLVAAIHNPAKPSFKLIYASAGGLLALIGIGLNVRHLWIQSLPPDQVPACGPSLDYLLQALSVYEALKTVLSGAGECAEIAGSFMGLTLPAWTLGLFIMLLAISFFGLIKKG